MTGAAKVAAETAPAAARAPNRRVRSGRLPLRPYPGLRPFEKTEWPIFRGRGRLVQDVLTILAERHFVSVIGPSGSGKSSLVRAGVLAALERRHGRVGVHWRTATMRPGVAPLWSMADGLLRSLRPELIAAEGEPPADEVAKLRVLIDAGEDGLGTIARELGLAEHENVLLLVDQFEEIFRYRSDEDDRERARLVELLVKVVRERPAGFYVVTTMRSEYLGDCARFTGLAETLNDTHYLLPRMTEGELREAIVEPAVIKRGCVQEALVDRLIADIEGQEDQLPILQHTLLWLWIQEEERQARDGGDGSAGIELDLAAYEQLEAGRSARRSEVKNALSRHGDKIFNHLAPEEQKVAAIMFRRMVEVEEHSNRLRRPTRAGTVAKLAEGSLDVVQSVVDAFRADDASFIRASQKCVTENTSIDIMHESLIRQWSTLDHWVRREKASYEAYDSFCRAAQRMREGRGALLTGLELTHAQHWLYEERPTRLWARRYGGDFDAALQFLTDSSEAEEQRQREQKKAEEAARRRQEEEWGRRRREELEAARLRADQAEARNEAAAARAEAAETRRVAQRSKYKIAIIAIVACGAIAAGSAVAFAYHFGQKQAEQQARATARALALRGKDLLEREGATAALLIAIEGLDNDAITYVPEMETLAYDALHNLRERRIISAHEDQVSSSEFARRDGTLLTAGGDGWLRLWNPATGRLLDQQQLPEQGFLRARWSQDSEWIVAGSGGSGKAYLRPVQWLPGGAPDLGTPVEFGDGELKAGHGVFSPDGRLILTGSFGHAPRLWSRSDSPAEPRSIWEGIDTGFAVAFSADGQRFATGGNDGIIRVYGTANQYLLQQQPIGGGVFSLDFHPSDADVLLATSLGGRAFLWNVTEPEPRQLKGHEGGLVFDGAFTSDGRFAATAAEDNTIRLWQVARPEDVPLVLRGHTSSVFSLSAHPERPWLASSSSDKTVRIWQIAPALSTIAQQGMVPATSGHQSAAREDGAAQASVAASEVLVERDGRQLVWDASTSQSELRLEGSWLGPVVLGKPRDLLRPVDAAIAPNGDYVLVAPQRGRLLFYSIASPEAPVAGFGPPEAEWASVEFDDGQPVSTTTAGLRQTWTYYADRRELIVTARKLLPHKDGGQVRLSHDRLCSLGVKTFEECSQHAAQITVDRRD